MTEPTTFQMAQKIIAGLKGYRLSSLNYADDTDLLTREIGAIIKQRVAAAVEQCAVTARGGDHTVCEHGAGYIDGRLDAEAAIRAAAGRPAPEGVAPDLARPRCSTPSQEDTQPGCGEKLWLWKNGDHYLAFAHEYPTYGGGDPMVLGEPAGYAMLVPSEPRRADPPTDAGRPGSATPSQEDTGPVSGDRWRPIDSAPEDGTVVWVYVASAHGLPAFQGSCAYHRDGGWCADELRPVTHWVPIECVYMPPPNVTGGPGSASNTESSPTQTVAAAEYDAKAFAAAEREISRLTHENADLRTAMRTAVAAPGPTAGDVERARTVMNEADHQIETWKDAPGVVVGRSTYINTIAAALSAERAELLAQIITVCGPQEQEAWSRDAIWAAGKIRNRVRALADKLTEAK